MLCALMSKSEDIAGRFWSLREKGEEEARRESLFLDDLILKAHVEREIDIRLDGVRSVLDVGAGSGRFTIPLAQRGFAVTHLDISLPMLNAARRKAEDLGVAASIEFIHGRLGDLEEFRTDSFDLVLCCDAPISSVYPHHEEAIRQLLRVAAISFVFGVSSRLGWIPYVFNPEQKRQYFVEDESDDPLVKRYLRNSTEQWTPDVKAALSALTSGLLDSPERIASDYDRGLSPWPVTYLFVPEELGLILDQLGTSDVRMSGPGALSRSIPNAVLRRLLLDEQARGEFLDLCYRFDSQPSVAGYGKDNLVVSGRSSVLGT